MCLKCVRKHWFERAQTLTAEGWGVMGLSSYTDQHGALTVIWDVVGWPGVDESIPPELTRYEVRFDK